MKKLINNQVKCHFFFFFFFSYYLQVNCLCLHLCENATQMFNSVKSILFIQIHIAFKRHKICKTITMYGNFILKSACLLGLYRENWIDFLLLLWFRLLFLLQHWKHVCIDEFDTDLTAIEENKKKINISFD